jgi:hypothetical protein
MLLDLSQLSERTQSAYGQIRLLSCLPLIILALGLLARIIPGYTTFLNPDEALHLFLSDQPGLRQAYEASLTTAHPPLMILFLSEWQRLGSSEWFLRLPFILAGTIFSWIMFLWVGCVADNDSSLYALALFSFSPSLIALSAEIRQYSLLLLFCGASLYLLETGLMRDSSARIAASSMALYLALLTHYSSLIFALAAAIYATLRLKPWRGVNLRVIFWATGQVGALALCAGLYFSHIRPLRNSGIPNDIAETWLRSSLYQPGQDSALHFAVHQTTRLFRFAMSQGTIGTIALILCIVGIIRFLVKNDGSGSKALTRWQLCSLLVLPFVITLSAALAGAYPYGGTRHDVILVLFGLTGTSLGLAGIPGRWKTVVWPLVIAGLMICNLFPFPTPPYILRQNQQKHLMTAAVGFLQQHAAPGDLVLSDFEGGLLLSRYFCQAWRIPSDEYTAQLFISECNQRHLIVPAAKIWHFDDSNFSSIWQLIAKDPAASADRAIWFFQSGWIDDKENAWIEYLQNYGCTDPQNFGPNILICRLQLPPPGRANQ